MKKNNLAKKADTIFIAITLFIFLFIIYFYLYKKTLFSIALSLLSLLVIELIFFGATKNKRKKIQQSASEKRHCEEIFFNLPYFNISKINKFFSGLLTNAGFEITHYNNTILATKGELIRNLVFCFKKDADNTTIYDCEQQRQSTESDGFILLCGDINEDAKEAYNNIENDKNIIADKIILYQLMKKNEFYPEIIYKKKNNKKAVKELFAYMFKRERFKNYFILAVIMFLFSFISPFENYYLIFSALLFFFCLFTLFNGNREKDIKNNSAKDLFE